MKVDLIAKDLTLCFNYTNFTPVVKNEVFMIQEINVMFGNPK